MRDPGAPSRRLGLRATVGVSKAGLNPSGWLSVLAGCLGWGTSLPILLLPEDPLRLGEETASLPPVCRGGTQHRLQWGLNAHLASYLVAPRLGSQSHGAVGRVVWENVRDAEVKTLQDIRGLHLPRETEPWLEQSWRPRLQPRRPPAPRWAGTELAAAPPAQETASS